MNKISKDIQRSLNQLENILIIIEEKINLPKRDIIREISIKLGIDVDAANVIFKNYCIVEDGLISSYILYRKRSEVLKVIKDIEDTKLIDEEIIRICQCDREYFNRMLKEKYGVGMFDIIKSDNFEDYIVEPINVNDIRDNMHSVCSCIDKLNKGSFIDVSIKRTKIKVNNINWEVCFDIKR